MATLGTDSDGRKVTCDVQKLIDTRLLVQANSGGGKSWCLRRLLEQTHGKVQQLVIDPEGEFATLRERYDYVLAAPHGADTVAQPRSAAMLAERLLELGVSAVLDIYELKHDERVAFVDRFCRALVDAKKKLWHPVLVVIDEAHVFCPEGGKNHDSMGAVIDLCTRGRKRGFCPVLATQRLATLNKNAAAQCNNKLIGRTALDVDMKRAAFELGFDKHQMQSLRALPEGHFFAFGPAIAKTVTQLHVGEVATTHPKAGARLAFVPPPPTAKVTALLPKLADLPAEAEERAKTVEALRTENASLRRELTTAKKAIPPPPPAPKQQRVEVPVLKGHDLQRLESAIATGTKLVEKLDHAAAACGKAVDAVVAVRTQIKDAVHVVASAAARMQAAPPARGPVVPPPVPRATLPATNGNGPHHRPTTPRASTGVEGEALKKGARKILAVLSQHPDGCRVGKLTLLTGYRYSGGFKNDLAALRTAGFITGGNTEVMRITAEGLAVGPFPELPAGRALVEHWLTHPSFKKGARTILQALLDTPEGLTADGLTKVTGYAYSGGFKNDLSALRTAGVLVGKNTEQMRACDELLEAQA